MQQKNRSIIILLILISNYICAFDRSFFYRTSSFWGEPRFEKDLLSTFDLQLSGGSAHCCLSDFCSNSSKSNCCNKDGLFSICEINFNYWQNIYCGFFTHFHLPFALIALRKFDINLQALRCVGMSDCSLFIGKTINYENTEDFDFIDLTLQAGILFPSGRKKSLSNCLDIPYGYNGHYAFTYIADASFGYFDWLTCGIHFDGAVFFKKYNNISTGAVWRVGTFTKADHFCSGLSLLIALTYEQKQKPDEFKRAIVQFVLDYDFARSSFPIGPNINIFYNLTLWGKKIIKTNTLGGILGANIAWSF